MDKIEMEPPELKTEESSAEVPKTESVPQAQAPVPMDTNTPAKWSKYELIVSRAEETHEFMESLQMENHLPSVNVPERIIIAMDVTDDENNICLHDERGREMKPVSVFSSALQMFISIKSKQNPGHKFSLITLKEGKAFWVDDPNKKAEEVIKILRTNLGAKDKETIDLTSIFTLIANAKMFTFFDKHSIPPPYIVRLILIHNKSHTLPQFNLMENFKEILNCPYFFVDIVAVHEPVSSENKCEEIFKLLQSIDTKGYSYFFNVGKSVEALVNAMLKILGHPLQRPLQSVADYSL